MRPKSAIPLLFLVLVGCVPVLVGGLILHSSKSNADKRAFLSSLEATNTERERAGLQPLDVCSEKYKFDPGWAAEEPNCLARIKRYQAGDSTALNP